MLGIVTFYSALNYGAILQAFALQYFLESNGYQVEIIPHHAVRNKEKKVASEERLHYVEAIKESMKLLNIGETGRQYDLVILGSDEIWNIRNRTCFPFPILYGYGVKTKKLISYAACSGRTKKFDLYLFPYSICGIKRLDAVSVRDVNTAKLLQSIGIQAPVQVLDPTFLVKFDSFRYEVREKDYIFIYSYGLKEEYQKLILEFASKLNKRIIASGRPFAGADKYVTPSALEWISYIKDATYYFTSTFHGTVFGLKNQKQMLVFGGNSAKIKHLLNEFDFEQCLYNEGGCGELFTKLQQDYDYGKFDSKLDPKIKESKEFLLRNIN